MTNACLYSGGKDSTMALHKASERGINIDLLISMLPENNASYMFHHPNMNFTRLQAEALSIRQEFVNTKGEKEKELLDLENAFKNFNVKLLVTGATYSRYQADRIRKITDRLEIENMAPLWHVDPLAELNELSEKYEAIISSVSAEGLDDSYLGERIDKKMIARLEKLNKEHGINMVFEGGEAESFVLNAPLFKKRIKIKKARKEWDGTRGTFIIEDAELIKKD